MLRGFGPGGIGFAAIEVGFPGFGVNEEVVAEGGDAEVLFPLGVEVEFAGGRGEDLDDQDGGVRVQLRGQSSVWFLAEVSIPFCSGRVCPGSLSISVGLGTRSFPSPSDRGVGVQGRALPREDPLPGVSIPF
jgi:hypothetical protein